MEEAARHESDRASGFRSGLTLVLLFAAGLVLGLCLMEPQLVQRTWQALAEREVSAHGPAGKPGEDVWRTAPGDPGATWFRVIVGAEGAFEASEAAPDEGDADLRPPPAPADSPPTRDPEGPASTSVVVERGATLWSIATSHYGERFDEELLEALARHNRLESPSRVETGQRLWLPPVERLLGRR